ncbi:MAG: ABC transporter ATP-binding protein [Planctomycetota bacterium]
MAEPIAQHAAGTGAASTGVATGSVAAQPVTAELTATGLCKSYPTPAEPLRVLQDVSLRLAAGESLAVVGPSGSGKSTLLAILGCLDRPTAGRLSVNGQDPFALPDDRLPAFRGANIGFVFQDHHLLPQCTVLENVLTPLLATGAAGPRDQDHARELLDRVGLSGRLTHRPAELSGGERQRVAIARAMIRRPAVLLADEPTGNLDAETGRHVGRLLLELNAARGSILVTVTHSGELAGAMDRRLRLSGGRLVEPDTPAGDGQGPSSSTPSGGEW